MSRRNGWSSTTRQTCPTGWLSDLAADDEGDYLNDEHRALHEAVVDAVTPP